MTEKHHLGESSEPASRPSARPSLTGQQQAAPGSGESVSILSAVSQPRAPAPSPVPKGLSKALPWLGVIALIAIGVTFWIELGKTRTPAAETAATAPPASAVVATPSPAALPAAAPSSSSPSPEPATQAATIETESLQHSDEKSGAVGAAAAGESPKASDHSQVAKAEPARQRSPFAAFEPPAEPRKPKPASAPAAPTGNTDVDLLQALLAVTPDHPVAGQPKPALKIDKPKPKPVVIAKASSRDVVNNDPVIGTAELVRRCEKLGVLESELCKTRICSGIWGKDAACPLPSTAAPEVN